MRIRSIKEIDPEPARCIEVESEDRLFAAGGENGDSFLTHNSVVQRNIILGCILRPDSWRFLGIDLKKVELSQFRAYSNVVLGIATTLEDALTVLRFAQQTMMKRYSEMEQLGVNNFLDLPTKGQALMVMVDEAGELLSPGGGKNEEAKAEDALKGEASMIIGSIARLGRAAGVHLVIATQRPDAKLIPGETKANLGVRINCGQTNSTASSMILESSEGVRVKSNPRGRLYLSIYGKGDHGQGFFAKQDWIDEYLASKGLNPDGSPISQKRSRLAKLTDMSSFAEGDLDKIEGVDNASVIEKIREEEEEEGILNNGDSSKENVESYDEDFEFQDDEDEDDSPSPSPSNHSIESEDDDSDDEDFEWATDDNDDEEADEPKAEEPKDDRPLLTGGKTDASKFTRPEDDWDLELEELIKENNS
jgi:hypothetical protein